VNEAAPLDEMVDGRGRIRAHWREVLSSLADLPEGGLAERAKRLDRAFEEEGVTSLLPGAGRPHWRCDPVPLALAESEFRALASGLAQRARLLEALLGDMYGPQRLLASGVIPPALVFANPGFLRPCRHQGRTPPRPLLQSYAADLLRGPDGGWRVLADRTTLCNGIGQALENRRLLARVAPEVVRAAQTLPLRPFFDMWQDSLQRFAPSGHATPAVALLTPGAGHPMWFEHMILSRELSCALVEGGDLTVRGGELFLKTLSGLQRVDVLLRRMDGRSVDPLEFTASGVAGVPGLLDAARHGAVRVLNDPGAGAAEAPALAAFLPALCRALLDEDLLLPSVETLWLGEERDAARVLAELPRWLIRPAMDGIAPAMVPAQLDAGARAALARRIALRPWDFAASARVTPSVAPTVAEGRLMPRPVLLRLFLIGDGERWHALPGGLARVLGESDAFAGRLPREGVAKDVWVQAEERTDILGPAAMALPPLAIRRTPGELPTRIADNLFWLGRYAERLEAAARLMRAALPRLDRAAALPREQAELIALARCLAEAGIVAREDTPVGAGSGALAAALVRSGHEGGRVAQLAAEVARLVETVRDRMSEDMHAAFTLPLRGLAASLRAARDADALSAAIAAVLRWAAGVAGVAAENMVRGGGFLFLDLGRRIERAQAIAREVGIALDGPPARVEGGLKLALELCDSVLTYRQRYLTVLQPAPALDLVLADPGNPRALGFQLQATLDHLGEIAGPKDELLRAATAALLREAEALPREVLAAREQAVAAASLPPRLFALADDAAALSDRIARRYFALLPAARTLGGPEPEDATFRGAA
jgi:uncharacterized circularly permuted ATP-grasp superfamily protein/uncharacterized alpha-E superfamily protein